MPAHSEVVFVPTQQMYFIRPPSNSEWKVTAVTVNGPSFSMRFSTTNTQGSQVQTERVLIDEANLRTEIHITHRHWMLFHNQSNNNVYGFFSATDP